MLLAHFVFSLGLKSTSLRTQVGEPMKCGHNSVKKISNIFCLYKKGDFERICFAFRWQFYEFSSFVVRSIPLKKFVVQWPTKLLFYPKSNYRLKKVKVFFGLSVWYFL